MLDYDAMRSKVRKLTEKPDKDPGRLPRTEKEAEMVSMNDFLRETEEDPETMLDLSAPSPPKILDCIKRVQQLQQEDEEMVRRHGGWSGISRSPSIMSRVSNMRRSARLSDGTEDDMLQRSPSVMSHVTAVRMPHISSPIPMLRESSAETLRHSNIISHTRSDSQRTVSMPSTSRLLTITPSHPQHKRISTLGQSPSMISTTSTKTRQNRSRFSGGQHSTTPSTRTPSRAQTPFLAPSELEDLMRPLREEYIRTQTNELAQAKAAYDQLNEQLTNELPQLIDLR